MIQCELTLTCMWQCTPYQRSFSVNWPLPVCDSAHPVGDDSVWTDPYLYVTVHTLSEIIQCEWPLPECDSAYPVGDHSLWTDPYLYVTVHTLSEIMQCEWPLPVCDSAPWGRSFSVKWSLLVCECASCGRSCSVNWPLPVCDIAHPVGNYSVWTDPYLYVTVHTLSEIIQCEWPLPECDSVYPVGDHSVWTDPYLYVTVHTLSEIMQCEWPLPVCDSAPWGRSFSVKWSLLVCECASCGRSCSVNWPLPVCDSTHPVEDHAVWTAPYLYVTLRTLWEIIHCELTLTCIWQCTPCGDHSMWTDSYLYVTVRTLWKIIQCELILTCMWQCAPCRKSSPRGSPDQRNCWSKTRHVYPRQISGISCSGVMVRLPNSFNFIQFLGIWVAPISKR